MITSELLTAMDTGDPSRSGLRLDPLPHPPPLLIHLANPKSTIARWSGARLVIDRPHALRTAGGPPCSLRTLTSSRPIHEQLVTSRRRRRRRHQGGSRIPWPENWRGVGAQSPTRGRLLSEVGEDGDGEAPPRPEPTADEGEASRWI
jgi:hypothetical protein